VTPPEAKRLVIVGTVGAGTLAAVGAFRRGGGPTVRLAVGVFAAGTLLAVAAEVAPEVAGGMAVLMLTTSALVLGGDAWAGISTAVRTAPTTAGKQLSAPAPKGTR